MPACVLDHITITAPSLSAGEALVQGALGIAPQAGGEHPRMGTHNLLLRLGDAMFLEVIASNPAADAPNRPRWFALDTLDSHAAAALKTWVLRTENIAATRNASPEPLGHIEAMRRGDYQWQITIPSDGGLPLDGVAPALVEWTTKTHPAATLTDHGLSLLELQLHHPQAQRVERLLDAMDFTGPVTVFKDDRPGLLARIQTPDGVRELGRR